MLIDFDQLLDELIPVLLNTKTEKRELLGIFERQAGAPLRLKRSASWVESALTDVTPFSKLDVESFQGALSGISLDLRKGCLVDWAKLTAKWGESEELGMALDAWGGPIPFRFRVAAVPDVSVRGSFVVNLAQPGDDLAGWRDDDTPVAPIAVGLIARRTVDIGGAR